MTAQIAKFSFVDKVIFVNPIRSLRNTRAENNLLTGEALKPGIDILPSKQSSNIWVYSPYRFLPLKRHFRFLEKMEERIFYRVINHLNLNSPFILLINDPIKSSEYLLRHLLKRAHLSIFDFSDDFVEYFVDKDDPRRSRCLENIKQYAGAVDIVLTVNQHVKDKFHYVNEQIEVLKNATNYDNFDRKAYAAVDFLEPIKNLGSPMVGYTGGIRKNRIDFDLLDHVLYKKSDWQFVFIGDADSAFREHYKNLNNVHLFPPVEYKKLPDCLQYLGLAFVPFICNEHTRGNDLLKIYDYLAMGKPVVSTDVGGADDLKDVLYVADYPEDFVKKMNIALKENSPHLIRRRKSVGLENSWPVRMTYLEQLLQQFLEEKASSGRTHEEKNEQ
jgi:glycosyltransferase involved in cell wall biosynthesis